MKFKKGEEVWVSRTENYYRGKVFEVGRHNHKNGLVSLRLPSGVLAKERYRFVREGDVCRYGKVPKGSVLWISSSV